MKCWFQILIPVFAAVTAFSAVVHPSPSAQAVPSSTQQQGEVVITKLAPPVYPPLARQTRIVGDVKLLLGVRSDGTVESSTVVSGHPLLQQAALDSARNSQFACEACSEPVTPYTLVFTFQITDGGCPPVTTGSSQNAASEAKTWPHGSQSLNHVTIVTEGIPCDAGVLFRRVRSAKCLYLWKCRWKP